MQNSILQSKANNLGLWLIRLILAAYLISLAKTLFDWTTGGPTQNLFSLGLAIAQCAVAGFAEYDVRKGRRARGGLVLITGLLVGLMITQWTASSGTGWLLGPILVLSLSLISSLLLRHAIALPGFLPRWSAAWQFRS